MWSDLIEAFKWVRWFNKGDIGQVVTVNEQVKTRNNGLKLDQYKVKKKQAEIGLQIR